MVSPNRAYRAPAATALRVRGAPAPACDAQAQAQLEVLLRGSTDVILVADEGHRVFLASDAAARAFQVAPATILRSSLAQLLSADTFAAYRRQARGTLDGQVPEPGQCRRRDGSTFPIEYTLAPYPSPAGRCVLLVARDLTRRREMQRRERMNGEFQVALVAEAEARQAALARELHDAVASSLAGVGLLLGAARLSLHDAKVAGLVATSHELVLQAIQQVRQISRGMLPAGQESEALVAALEQFVAETQRLPGIACDLAIRGDIGRVPGEVGAHLFRIAQEATANALRHGKATRLRIRLARVGARCWLTIHDNGAGCDPRVFSAPAAGMGVRSMRARAEAIGASLSIRSEAGRGCRVRVRWDLPFPPSGPDQAAAVRS